MYTIKEASARSGVGIPLLRAWERRYGVVRPMRTSSGYRLYDDASIDRLRAMRQLIATGWSAQQAAQQVDRSTDAELASLAQPAALAREAAGTDASPPSASIDDGPARALIGQLVEAARDIDAAALEAALDEAYATARFEPATERVVMPALRAIGNAWERGEISVAGEHAASHAVLRRLAMAYEAAADSAMERPVLVGLGPGARHELGALAFAVAARRAGLPVLYLGPDLPAESWVAAAAGRRARAAVVGVATRADVRRATDVLDALRAASPETILVVGGDAAERDAGDDVIRRPSRLGESVAALRAVLDAARSI